MKTKEFLFLDGLRGLAAIFVLNVHTGDFWGVRLPHAHLAVDIFFLLSGFVIASAYDAKIENGLMTKSRFIVTRLFRLYPIYAMSLTLCGVVAFAQILYADHPVLFSWGDVMQSFLLNLFFIPSYMPGADARALFSLNPVYWTLFFELAANLIYIFIRPYLSHLGLILIIVFFGTVLVCFSMYFNKLDLGVDKDLPIFAAGLSRALFGFFDGLYLYKIRHYLHRIPMAILGKRATSWFGILAISTALCIPDLGAFNGAGEVITVVICFPVLLCFVAVSQPRRTHAVMFYLGASSYPLYLLQIPAKATVKLIDHGWFVNHAPYSGVVFLLILLPLAIWVERCVDVPFRRYLNRRYLRTIEEAAYRPTPHVG
jgi:peptidoglycan/LPS O-acetylase OafA/YrhL